MSSGGGARERAEPAGAHDAAWRPSASVPTLRLRAALLARIRAFFAERDVLEVETPVLGACAVTDPHVLSLATSVRAAAGAPPRTYFLHTSPEYAMKRLLAHGHAQGLGPIYQICRVFRDGEEGRLHCPEFTMLEWYRPGFDHHALIAELDELMARLLPDAAPARHTCYFDAFREHAGIDPASATLAELRDAAAACGLVHEQAPDRDTCLELVFSHRVQPALGRGRVFVYDFPACQAALARVRDGRVPVAERFELFHDGIELANGFHELTDAAEQRRRFARDAARRRELGLDAPAPDERLLAALAHGLPPSAGVAVGLDRVFMLAAGAGSVAEVMAFPASRA